MWVIRDLVITLVLLLGVIVSLVVIPIITIGMLILVVGVITYAAVHDARIKAQAQKETDTNASENDS